MDIQERLQAVETTVKMAELATKKVLTFEEAAQFTGFSKSYLYKLASGQKIPHYKPAGKLVFFNREELQAWLLQNRVSTSDEISLRAQTYCAKRREGYQCV